MGSERVVTYNDEKCGAENEGRRSENKKKEYNAYLDKQVDKCKWTDR